MADNEQRALLVSDATTAPRGQDASRVSALLRPPTISLPKGGGAIRGIGEKFAANPVTGTGSMSVPIATSPGRSGFGPQLALSYDSGAGNGPFGFGWSLSSPAITRKTDKGLPRYADVEESDVYILSGAEDLVPVLQANGSRFEDNATAPGYTIHRYRPRVEGLFARIERWTHRATGAIHWRSISRENITTWYGRTANSRVFDPNAVDRIFSWLICESYDDKGNAIVYEYAEEDNANVDLALDNERNRTRTANRYPKRIKYGNRTSRLIQPDLTKTEWLFEVVFDYDEGHYEDIDLDPARPAAEQHRYIRASVSPGKRWAVRPDPFSSHRATFEVRSYRRVRRVLAFNCFTELGDEPCLVRATELEYRDIEYTASPGIEVELAHQGSTRLASLLCSVTQSGFVRDDAQPVLERNGARYVTYLKKSLPSLDFEYSRPSIQDAVLELDADSLENLPAGLDGLTYRWVDLDGEGVSGILTEQAGAWFYKPNLGSGRFGAVQRVALAPSMASLSGGSQQLLDLAGDGQLDLVDFAGPIPGFFERTDDPGWEPFRTFAQLPNAAWNDPNLRFVDLDGDGHADMLITEQDVLTWHPSLGEDGFGSALQVRQARDEEEGPRLLFADGSQSVFLADMSGDGLTDLVRIRNGEICYWANEGYGRFGAKVTMDNAPWFEADDQFDTKRIRLGDIDGSGTTDVIYLGRDDVRLYFNQSGNWWSAPRTLTQFPHVDDLSAVTTADLLGNGTACLVWSSPLAGDAREPVRYVDLMGGQKPHLLLSVANNLGAETHLQYAASTKFYLADKAAGTPWITRLPFPVHVVERVDTFDRISRSRFVSRYAYHHGYFDGVEREWRGWGRVDRWDTEEYAALAASREFPTGENVDAASHVPPVHTKTWFHTGVFAGSDHVSDFFAGLLDANDVGEYYREPGLTDAQARALLLDDTVLPIDLSVEEAREACRALKGSILRQEIYSPDGTPQAVHPYSVSERSYAVQLLQPRYGNRHAVFLTRPSETIDYHYERNPSDPRISHNLTLEVDEFGNALKLAAVGYGRRQPDPTLSVEDQAKQTTTLVTYTENRLTEAIETADSHRWRLPCDSRAYELTGYAPSGAAGRFLPADLVRLGPNGLSHVFDAEIEYELKAANGRQRRLIEEVRTYYRPNDLGAAQGDSLALSPLGEAESLSLPGETYKVALTPGLLTQVYRRARTGQPPENLLPHPDTVLPADIPAGQVADRCGYVDLDGDHRWWVPSGRLFRSPDGADDWTAEGAFARQHFFLPKRYRDPFGQTATVTHDAYDLLLMETSDPLGNRLTVGERDRFDNLTTPGNDYRVLQPRLVMDPNRNRSSVIFDALGLVAGTAVMGKPEEDLGDCLDGFEADLTDAAILNHLDQPTADPNAVLARATARVLYDLFAYQRSQGDPVPEAPAVCTWARETHDADLPVGGESKVQFGLSYSDGFGREIQKKIQAEPGPAPMRDAAGNIVIGQDGQPEMTDHDVDPRWVGSGWTIFNNKGKPVRQYEPFFTDTHRFDCDVRIGVTPTLFYDPVERVVATLHPNHTYEKVVFDAWSQATWDVNDTVVEADPKNDADVGNYFKRLPKEDYLPTWHTLRTDPAYAQERADTWPDPKTRDAETSAAAKAAAHADTPTVAHFDVLGRTFLTIADNGPKGKYPTRVRLDIEGNQREVRDAVVQNGDTQGRVVMRYAYDMLSNRIHQASMEAGARWTLNDVAGKPIRAWDSRGHTIRAVYDDLRRPTDVSLTEAPGNTKLVERTEYGDTQPTPEAHNLRGKVYRLRDGAGIVTNDDYDFKGNLVASRRELLDDYRATPDWSQNPATTGETFRRRTWYDALNRPIQAVAPHSDQAGAKVNVVRPGYNEANLLERVDVWLQQATEPSSLLGPDAADQHCVKNVDYNAKGQRALIEYGNGAATACQYDPWTFRLTSLKTVRPGSGGAAAAALGLTSENGLASQHFKSGTSVQDLRYVYDPTGNITQIADDALPTVFHNNEQVDPTCRYTYDAIYRLIEAKGREHIDQAAFQVKPPNGNYRDYPFAGASQVNDDQAVRNYTEGYEYDPVGNFDRMIHQATNGDWTRSYAHNEASLLEPVKKSNRLSSTTVGNNALEPYTHDEHGNMTSMPHLPVIRWDHKDQLQATAQQVVVSGTPETTCYVYDATGQRVRKVTDYQAAAGQQVKCKAERLYLGGFEIYREYEADGTTVALERETLHVMDDKRRVAFVETRTKGNDPSPSPLVRYQHGNHLGSACLELDDQARIISYEEYYPYGTTSYQAVRNQTETPKRYRYTGKERDEETGLCYHGARYYAPWLGRWMSCDSELVLLQAMPLYVYCRCNPIALMDPDGRAPTIADIVKRPGSEAAGAVAGALSPLQLTSQLVEHSSGWKPENAQFSENVEGNTVPRQYGYVSVEKEHRQPLYAMAWQAIPKVWRHLENPAGVPTGERVDVRDYLVTYDAPVMHGGKATPVGCAEATAMTIERMGFVKAMGFEVRRGWSGSLLQGTINESPQQGRAELTADQRRTLSDAIEASLYKGVPIRVGVDIYPGQPEESKGNLDKVTEHWLTVFARDYDPKGRVFFWALENASGDKDVLRRLYVGPNLSIWKEVETQTAEDYWVEHSYLVTNVKPVRQWGGQQANPGNAHEPVLPK